MRHRVRAKHPAMQDRVIWQCAATLLSYPDDRDPVDELLAHADGEPAALIARTASAVQGADPLRTQADYVATFDQQRRCSLYLTYWTAGETRNRGAAMLAFTRVYRDSGVQPPRGEAPDFLPVVLEFAATVDPDAGRSLLVEHRVPLAAIHQGLAEVKSPYSDTVAAVLRTLPTYTERDAERAQYLARTGPPTESVGLQPFTLSVPPRRAQGG